MVEFDLVGIHRLLRMRTLQPRRRRPAGGFADRTDVALDRPHDHHVCCGAKNDDATATPWRLSNVHAALKTAHKPASPPTRTRLRNPAQRAPTPSSTNQISVQPGIVMPRKVQLISPQSPLAMKAFL